MLLMNSYFPRISLKSTHSIFRDLKFSHALGKKKVSRERTKELKIYYLTIGTDLKLSLKIIISQKDLRRLYLIYARNLAVYLNLAI